MNHNRKRSVLVWILVLLFLVFLLFPFYWMFVTSVKTDAEIYASPWFTGQRKSSGQPIKSCSDILTFSVT